jgi:ABC-type multidrug transport system ATPase subunit
MALVTDASFKERSAALGASQALPPPLTPSSVAFSGISYEVQTLSKETLAILKGPLSGSFAPGKLTAIQGPSGAGKTSLLNILAGRVAASAGSLYLDCGTPGGGTLSPGLLSPGLLSPSSQIRGVSAYVQQDDCMLATQTVRETVVMAALLTLPAGMGVEEKVARADDVIELFGLGKCKDT